MPRAYDRRYRGSDRPLGIIPVQRRTPNVWRLLRASPAAVTMTVVPPAAAMMMTMAMVVTVISNVGARIDCLGPFADWCYRSRVNAGRGCQGQPGGGKRSHEKRPHECLLPEITACASLNQQPSFSFPKNF